MDNIKKQNQGLNGCRLTCCFIEEVELDESGRGSDEKGMHWLQVETRQLGAAAVSHLVLTEHGESSRQMSLEKGLHQEVTVFLFSPDFLSIYFFNHLKTTTTTTWNNYP